MKKIALFMLAFGVALMSYVPSASADEGWAYDYYKTDWFVDYYPYKERDGSDICNDFSTTHKGYPFMNTIQGVRYSASTCAFVPTYTGTTNGWEVVAQIKQFGGDGDEAIWYLQEWDYHPTYGSRWITVAHWGKPKNMAYYHTVPISRQYDGTILDNKKFYRYLITPQTTDTTFDIAFSRPEYLD